jgi:phosphatidylglycerophosphate synthase
MIRPNQMQRISVNNIFRFLWRNTPNAISLARLLATPILLSAVLWQRQELFKWLLLACLLSDILDGLIARIFRLRTRLGATLDSTADILVAVIMISGICVFQRPFLLAHIWEIALPVAMFVLQLVAAIWRYGRISSYHTVLNRIAAYAQGIFVMSLFLWGYQAWLFHPMIALTVAASVEEFLLLCVLPESRVDVRGLYWVLSNREIASR